MSFLTLLLITLVAPLTYGPSQGVQMIILLLEDNLFFHQTWSFSLVNGLHSGVKNCLELKIIRISQFFHQDTHTLNSKAVLLIFKNFEKTIIFKDDNGNWILNTDITVDFKTKNRQVTRPDDLAKALRRVIGATKRWERRFIAECGGAERRPTR